MSLPHAAGSIASTVEDMYRFDRALKEGTLLSDRSNQLLFTIHASSEPNDMIYGYGTFVDPVLNTVGHMGEIEGFRAATYRYVSEDLTVIVLTNQEKIPAEELQAELAALVLGSSEELEST